MNMYEIMLEEIQDSYLALPPTDKVNNNNLEQTLQLADYYSSLVLENLKIYNAELIRISLSMSNLFKTEECTKILVKIGNELDLLIFNNSKKHLLYTLHMPIFPEDDVNTFFNLSKNIYYGIANLKHYDAIKLTLNSNSKSYKNNLENLISLSNSLPLITV